MVQLQRFERISWHDITFLRSMYLGFCLTLHRPSSTELILHIHSFTSANLFRKHIKSKKNPKKNIPQFFVILVFWFTISSRHWISQLGKWTLWIMKSVDSTGWQDSWKEVALQRSFLTGLLPETLRQADTMVGSKLLLCTHTTLKLSECKEAKKTKKLNNS